MSHLLFNLFYVFQTSTGGSNFELPTYDKKLERKAAKVSLTKCEDGSLRSRNKNDNATTVSSSTKTTRPIMASATNHSNANLRNYALVESDSEYETEEVYELREWYPPDYWKSNNFIDNLTNSTQTSNLNHLRRKEEEGNNNNNKSRKQVCLTDVTVDDLTITMMEGQSEQGFFKTL